MFVLFSFFLSLDDNLLILSLTHTHIYIYIYIYIYIRTYVNIYIHIHILLRDIVFVSQGIDETLDSSLEKM